MKRDWWCLNDIFCLKMDVCVRLECSKSMKMFMFDGRRMLGDFMSCGAIMSQVFEADSNRLSTYRRPMNDQRNCIAGEPRNSKISVRKKMQKYIDLGGRKCRTAHPHLKNMFTCACF